MIKVYSRRQLMMDEVKAKPYISNGLVFHLDGDDATGTSWKDRIAGITYTRASGTTLNGGVVFNASSSNNFMEGDKSLAKIPPNVGTIEVCAHRTGQTAAVYNEVIYATSNVVSIFYRLDRTNNRIIISNYGGNHYSTAPVNFLIGKFTHSCNNVRSCFNGTMVEVSTPSSATNRKSRIGQNFIGTIYQIRIYNRHLTEEEMKWNQEQDRKRYGITF